LGNEVVFFQVIPVVDALEPKVRAVDDDEIGEEEARRIGLELLDGIDLRHAATAEGIVAGGIHIGLPEDAFSFGECGEGDIAGGAVVVPFVFGMEAEEQRGGEHGGVAGCCGVDGGSSKHKVQRSNGLRAERGFVKRNSRHASITFYVSGRDVAKDATSFF